MLVFPIALKPEEGQTWQPFGKETTQEEELYFGGLESVGFGRCAVTLTQAQSTPSPAEVA